jgi:cation transport regulator
MDQDTRGQALRSFARIGLTAMPYASNDELPPSVRNHLPPHAQDIFRETFNDAWTRYAGHARREEIAFRVAWSVVKKGYVRVGTDWVERRRVE